jgi:hypothetical protein
MQSMKDNSKTKMNNIAQLGCLISELLRLFVNFLSTIVVIFYRFDKDHQGGPIEIWVRGVDGW